MSFQLDATGDSSYDEVGSGFSRLPPGRFHAEIVEVDESCQKTPDKIVVEFEVLDGTVPDHRGRRHKEFFSLAPGATDRLKRLAMVTDLIQPGEHKDVSFTDALGKDLIIEIVPHSYERKDGKKVDTTQLAFGGMWKPDHKDVEEVPKGKVSGRDYSEEAEVGSGDSDEDAWGDI